MSGSHGKLIVSGALCVCLASDSLSLLWYLGFYPLSSFPHAIPFLSPGLSHFVAFPLAAISKGKIIITGNDFFFFRSS